MLGWLKRHQFLVLAAVIAVLGLSLLVQRFAAASPPALEFQTGSSLALGSPIRVHVAGAVLIPGVYELKSGDRVQDAVTAAGGPADDADGDAINLARRLRDEDQVLVPVRNTARSAAATTFLGGPVDINTAPAEVLNGLPGIGDAYSRRILDSRRVDGAFKSPQDLVDRKVLPRATFDRIRDLVVAGP